MTEAHVAAIANMPTAEDIRRDAEAKAKAMPKPSATPDAGHHILLHQQTQEKLPHCQSKLQKRRQKRHHRGENGKTAEGVEEHPHIEVATGIGTTLDVTMETEDGDDDI